MHGSEQIELTLKNKNDAEGVKKYNLNDEIKKGPQNCAILLQYFKPRCVKIRLLLDTLQASGHVFFSV
jgi:hypothetical protein